VPVAANGCVPPTPVLALAGVTAIEASDGVTTILNAWVMVWGVPAVSVTRAVKLKVLAILGVPVMAPVLAFRLSPGGSAPAASVHVYGAVPPEATRLAE
jgi:hypothetical protein